MYKRLILVLLVGIAVVLPLSSAFATESFWQPTEMLQWDPEKAYNGYTAFTMANGDCYLIDMQGQIVKKLPSFEGYTPSAYWHILENGNIRRIVWPDENPRMGFGSGPGGGIEELDWNGNLLWRWHAWDGDEGPTNTFRQHHEFQKIYNKDLEEYTYLALVWIKKGADDALKLGVAPQYSSSSRNGWSPCSLWEIRPKYGQTETGLGVEIVWFWTFADHFVTKVDNGSLETQEFTDAYGRLNSPVVLVGAGKTLADYPHKLDVNGVHYTKPDGPRGDMQHCNSFDYDDATGHIVINAKACNEFFVIDHDSTFVGGGATGFDAAGALARTSAGDFLYRFGNPANYESGDPAGWYDEGDMEMYGSHDIQFIRPYHWRPPRLASDNWPAPTDAVALRGGGALNANGRSNFLIFDNGCYNPVKRVSKLLEINPYIMDAFGALSTSYVDPGPLQPPGLNRRGQVVWQFYGTEADFYSLHISSTQRLPNGNTLGDSGRKGHFFEVTEDKLVVWEYVVPYRKNNTVSGDFGIVAALGQGDDDANSVFKAHRFGPDHPGLAGKDLTPGSTLTGRIPGTADVYVESAPITGWGIPPGTFSEGGAGAEAGEGGGGGY